MYALNAPTFTPPHDPHAFGARDVDDLRWWFNFAESDMGVHSSQGAQQDALIRRDPHHMRRRPFDEHDDPADADRRSQSQASGYSEAFADNNHERQIKTACPGCEPGVECHHTRWETAWISPHLMPANESRSTLIADPYPEEILGAIRRGRRIRATLLRTDSRQVLLLNAVYGPTVGNRQDSLAIRRRLGDLCEIAVAIMALTRQDTDESPRRMVTRMLTNESFITLTKRACEAYLATAHEAYATARRS